MGDQFCRKPNRMKTYDYASIGMYFLTICSQDRICIFRDPKTFEFKDLGRSVQTGIDLIETKYIGVRVEKYVIMPNHVHILIELQQVSVSISTIVSQFKRFVSVQAGRTVWQKSFYDHVIRSEDDYQKVWRYIDNNPAKWTEDKYFSMN